MRWALDGFLALRRPILGLVGIVGAIALAQRGDDRPPTVRSPLTGPGLTAFRRARRELRAFLRRVQSRSRRTPAQSRRDPPRRRRPRRPTAAEAQPAEPGITNNQEADVDEGGIVKVRGDILVILRRGRLFTVSLAGGGMRPVDSIDAFPPGVSRPRRLV